MKTKRRNRWLRWFIWMPILFVLLALVRFFVFDVYRVGGDAMSPLYQEGQVVFVCKLGTVRTGDVVLYQALSKERQMMRLIGRVAACPGDKFYAVGGDFYINGRASAISREMHKGYGIEAASRYDLHIPHEGDTMRLTPAGLLAYRSAIFAEQAGQVSFVGGRLYIDEKAVSTYRFAHSYYWILSENARSGPDSRHLGAIAHHCIVGRVVGAF